MIKTAATLDREERIKAAKLAAKSKKTLTIGDELDDVAKPILHDVEELTSVIESPISAIEEPIMAIQESYMDPNYIYIDKNSGFNYGNDEPITVEQQLNEYGNQLQMYYNFIDKTHEINASSINKLTSLTPVFVQKTENILGYSLFMCLDQGHDFHAGFGRGSSPGNWVSENYIISNSKINNIILQMNQTSQRSLEIISPCDTEFIQGLINTSFCGGKSVYGILIGNEDTINILLTSRNYSVEGNLDIQKIMDSQNIIFTKESKGVMSSGDGTNTGLLIDITDAISENGTPVDSIKLTFLPLNKYNYNIGMHRVWYFNKKCKIFSVSLNKLTIELLNTKQTFKNPKYDCHEVASIHYIVPEYTLNFEAFLQKFKTSTGIDIDQTNYTSYVYGTEGFKHLFDSFINELYCLDKFRSEQRLYEEHDIGSSPPNLPNSDSISESQLEFIKQNTMVRGAKYKFYNILSDTKKKDSDRYLITSKSDVKEEIFLNLLRGLYTKLSNYVHNSYDTPLDEINSLLDVVRDKSLNPEDDVIDKQVGFVLDTSMTPVPGLVIKAVVDEYWREIPSTITTTARSEDGDTDVESMFTDSQSIDSTSLSQSDESVGSEINMGTSNLNHELNYNKPVKYFNHKWAKKIFSNLKNTEEIFQILPNSAREIEARSSTISSDRTSFETESEVESQDTDVSADLGGAREEDDEDNEDLTVDFPYKFQIVSGAIDSSKMGGECLPEYNPPHLDIYMFIFDREVNKIQGLIVRLVFLKKINSNDLNKKSHVEVDSHFIYVDFDDIELSTNITEDENWKKNLSKYSDAYRELLEYVLNNTKLQENDLILELQGEKGTKKWHKLTYTDGGPTVGESIMNVTDKYASVQHFTHFITGTSFSIGEDVIHIAQKIYEDSEQIQRIFNLDSLEGPKRNRLFEKLFLVRNKFFGDKSRSLDTLFINKSKIIEGIQISNDENTFFNAQMYGHNEFWSTLKQTTFYMAPYYTKSGKLINLNKNWMQPLKIGLSSTGKSNYVSSGKKKLSSATIEIDICSDQIVLDCKLDILCDTFKEIKKSNEKLNSGITELGILDSYFTESIINFKSNPNIEKLLQALDYANDICDIITSDSQFSATKTYGLKKYFLEIVKMFQTTIDSHVKQMRRLESKAICINKYNEFLFKITDVMCEFQNRFNEYVTDINNKLMQLNESITTIKDMITEHNSKKENKRNKIPFTISTIDLINFADSIDSDVKMDAVLSECLSKFSIRSSVSATTPATILAKTKSRVTKTATIPATTSATTSATIPDEKKKRGRPKKTIGGALNVNDLSSFYNQSYKYNLINTIKNYSDLIVKQKEIYGKLVNNKELNIENIKDSTSFIIALLLLDLDTDVSQTIVDKIITINDTSTLDNILDINNLYRHEFNIIEDINSIQNGIVFLMGSNNYESGNTLSQYFNKWNTNIYNLLNFVWQKYQNMNRLDEITEYNYHIIGLLYYYLNKVNIDYISSIFKNDEITAITYQVISLYFIKYSNELLKYIIKFDIPSDENMDNNLIFKTDDVMKFIKNNEKNYKIQSYLSNIYDTKIVLSMDIKDNFNLIKNMLPTILKNEDVDSRNNILASVNGLLLLLFLYNNELKESFFNYYDEVIKNVKQFENIKFLLDEKVSENVVPYIIFYNGYMKQLIFTDTVYLGGGFQNLSVEDYVRHLIDTTIGIQTSERSISYLEQKKNVPVEIKKQVPNSMFSSFPVSKNYIYREPIHTALPISVYGGNTKKIYKKKFFTKHNKKRVKKRTIKKQRVKHNLNTKKYKKK